MLPLVRGLERGGRLVLRTPRKVAQGGRQVSVSRELSARAGMLTTASEAGVDLAGIMRQSVHERRAGLARNPVAQAVVDSLNR